MQNVGPCNLYPESDDVPHILLLDVRLHDCIVRAYVLHRIIGDQRLVLSVASQLEPLPL